MYGSNNGSLKYNPETGGYDLVSSSKSTSSYENNGFSAAYETATQDNSTSYSGSLYQSPTSYDATAGYYDSAIPASSSSVYDKSHHFSSTATNPYASGSTYSSSTTTSKNVKMVHLNDDWYNLAASSTQPTEKSFVPSGSLQSASTSLVSDTSSKRGGSVGGRGRGKRLPQVPKGPVKDGAGFFDEHPQFPVSKPSPQKDDNYWNNYGGGAFSGGYEGYNAQPEIDYGGFGDDPYKTKEPPNTAVDFTSDALTETEEPSKGAPPANGEQAELLETARLMEKMGHKLQQLAAKKGAASTVLKEATSGLMQAMNKVVSKDAVDEVDADADGYGFTGEDDSGFDFGDDVYAEGGMGMMMRGGPRMRGRGGMGVFPFGERGLVPPMNRKRTWEMAQEEAAFSGAKRMPWNAAEAEEYEEDLEEEEEEEEMEVAGEEPQYEETDDMEYEQKLKLRIPRLAKRLKFMIDLSDDRSGDFYLEALQFCCSHPTIDLAIYSITTVLPSDDNPATAENDKKEKEVKEEEAAEKVSAEEEKAEDTNGEEAAATKSEKPPIYLVQVYVGGVEITSIHHEDKVKAKQEGYKKTVTLLVKSNVETIIQLPRMTREDAGNLDEAEIDDLTFVAEQKMQTKESNWNAISRFRTKEEKVPLDQFVVFEFEVWHVHQGCNHSCVLRQSADSCRVLLEIEYEYDELQTKATVFLEGEEYGTATEGTMKRAKNKASARALAKLWKTSYSILLRDFTKTTNEAGHSNSTNEEIRSKVEESLSQLSPECQTLGTTLLLKLGYAGDLEPEPSKTGVTEMVEPVDLIGDVDTETRKSEKVAEQFKEKIQLLLEVYEKSGSYDEIPFSESLTENERRTLTVVARSKDFMVKKSVTTKYGDSRRKIMVTEDMMSTPAVFYVQQKQSPLELVSYLKKRDGKTGKYILAPPGEREKYVTVDAIESNRRKRRMFANRERDLHPRFNEGGRFQRPFRGGGGPVRRPWNPRRGGGFGGGPFRGGGGGFGGPPRGGGPRWGGGYRGNGGFDYFRGGGRRGGRGGGGYAYVGRGGFRAPHHYRPDYGDY